MSAKPARVRLVSKKQYRRVMRKKGSTYLTAILAGCFGLMFLAGAFLGAKFFWDGTWDGATDLVPFFFFGGLGLAGLWCGKLLFKDARQIEPVALLSTQNAKYLPDEKILVRGSERPSTNQQAELLRAIRQESETPPEQLLRAAPTNTSE